jgi:hypothetical protein
MTKRESPSDGDILNAYEDGHLVSVKPSKAVLKNLGESARATLVPQANARAAPDVKSEADIGGTE